MTAVITMGETLALMTTAEAGALATAHHLNLGIGGAESNVAIGLARLGCPATWIGRVGADPLGELVTREIRAEGVDVRAIVEAGGRTGFMIKERRIVGSSHVLYYRSGSAGSKLQPSDIDVDLIRSAQILHITGITPALSVSAAEAFRHAIAIARAASVRVSLDINFRSSLWQPHAASRMLRGVLSKVDIVFANLDEAVLLTGSTSTSAEQQAENILNAGPDEAVIKLGIGGAIANVRGSVISAPAVPVNAVDTVGAGDAFVAGYLAETCAGADATTALATATKGGAFACLTPGDWEGLPRRTDLSMLDNTLDPVMR